MHGEDFFDWDEGNAEHIAEHGISVEEAEEAILDPLRIAAPAYRGSEERRRGLLGATAAGRLLFLVFTHRNERVRVVTARDASQREKRRYRTQGK